jgi:hypothetical protein
MARCCRSTSAAAPAMPTVTGQFVSHWRASVTNRRASTDGRLRSGFATRRWSWSADRLVAFSRYFFGGGGGAGGGASEFQVS